MVRMGDGERDSTQDWLLPEQSRPPSIGDLVKRIDEAVTRARSSEAAAISIGAAALDAADQARRAVDLAERAATAMSSPHNSATSPATAVSLPDSPMASASVAEEPRVTRVADEDVLSRFSARADRVMERLQALERVPVSA